jgi:hypothetical protein
VYYIVEAKEARLPPAKVSTDLSNPDRISMAVTVEDIKGQERKYAMSYVGPKKVGSAIPVNLSRSGNDLLSFKED